MAMQSPMLTVGLLNNMPDTALRQTEAQFAGLLRAALPSCAVRLELFALGTVPRSSFAERAIATRYRPATQIPHAGLDALIVTGMEPGAGRLQDQPFWPELAACMAEVTRQALPTLWSCLAAHAAALHLDGIARQRLPRKLSGVFACAETGGTRTWCCAHSRLNEVTEEALVRTGYRITARLADGGVDAWAHASLPFAFLQGHPEYRPDTLAREYARDLQRYVAGISATRPAPPAGIFPPATERQLHAASAQAAIALLPGAARLPFPLPVAHTPAIRWLSALGEQAPAIAAVRA